jgi:hypothetical protein
VESGRDREPASPSPLVGEGRGGGSGNPSEDSPTPSPCPSPQGGGEFPAHHPRLLDQYKEKTPKDPTIRERFNTYRFADHKEKVVDLLARVTRVSVETMAIVAAMRAAPR